jgi:hypothetical protein
VKNNFTCQNPEISLQNIALNFSLTGHITADKRPQTLQVSPSKFASQTSFIRKRWAASYKTEMQLIG